MSTQQDILLQIKNLSTVYRLRSRSIYAVRNVSVDMREGEVLGVVGESGCGKTQMAMSMLRLIQSPPGEIAGGEVWLGDTEVLSLTSEEMRKIRGDRISIIFQEPMTALNPVFTVGAQISEALLLHRPINKAEAKQEAIRLLREVGIPDPEQRVDSYPFQLSGGLRQRVVIAIALACDPDLLIADEPTTALDVTVQAQILALFQRIREQRNQSILFITHDLAVLANFADRIMVMYAGEVVEIAPTEQLLTNPKHPYTQGLMASLPQNAIREGTGVSERLRLQPIPGTVRAQTVGESVGCPFADRCPSVMDKCRTSRPQLTPVSDGTKPPGDHEKTQAADRFVRCFLYSPETDDEE